MWTDVVGEFLFWPGMWGLDLARILIFQPSRRRAYVRLWRLRRGRRAWSNVYDLFCLAVVCALVFVIGWAVWLFAFSQTC